MASFPPTPGASFRFKNKLYRVKSIDSTTESVILESVDDKGNLLNSEIPPIGKKQWESRNYEDINQGTNPPEGGSKKGKNYSKFSFSFDPDTDEIIVTYPDGIKTERLQSIKGEPGATVFEEWCKRKGIKKSTANDWDDFIKSLRGDDGHTINGADAPSVYEEWKGRQNQGVDTSFNTFINSIRGKDGKNGYEGKDGLSAYEVWKAQQPSGVETSEQAFWDFLKGAPGTNGHEGKDGQDGDTWKPYLSEDGKLYFENIRTKDRTETIDISGPQGPSANDGKNGDTWEPFSTQDGHKLYFKNQHGDIKGPFDVIGATGATGKQGPQGESAYQIWLNEGHRGDFHDFLLWVARQANKGDDGKDGDTFRPHVENGHLFFISMKTGERIDGGCVIGPQGEQGEAGLNGHNVTHKYGYKEIHDWTCPVQEINPHLIFSSDDLASGGSAEKHMRETLNRINNLRADGKNIISDGPCKKTFWNKVLYFAKNPLKEFFWWCSGADRPLLRMCPAEHSKYMGIGSVIFFTALMAMVSSFFAISYVLGNHNLSSEHEKFGVCVIFAIFWGLMIFFLDRFITNTMYSDGKVTISWLELRSALPRILVSIFIGIVISAPLELKIFDKEINEYIESEATKIFNQSIFNPNLPELSSAYYQCKQDSIALKLAIDNYQTTRTLSPDEKDRRYTELKSIPTKFESYKYVPDGQGGAKEIKETTTSDSIIQVPSEQKYLEALKKDSFIVQTALRNDSISRRSLQTKRDSLIAGFNSSDALNQAGLYERLSVLHAIAFHENRQDDESAYAPWSDSPTRFWLFFIAIFLLMVIVSLPFTKNVTKSSDESDNSLENNVCNPPEKHQESFWTLFWKGAAVLWPWFAIVALVCAYCNNALFNALPYYIFSAVGMIMMLFILIDVSPVFYKMMLADGQYEQYLLKEKSITQDLVRLNFAKSIAKVNESELGRLAPLIFSKPFKKIKHILTEADNIQKEELGWTVKDKNGNVIETAHETISTENRELFATVLGMKKAIIEASYQAWYRDMRDAIIGMHKPTDPNSGNSTFNPNDGDDNDNDPASRARRETGHHTSDEESFDKPNYYGHRTGTSPDYEASTDDEYPETPEEILNGQRFAESESENHGDEEENTPSFDNNSSSDEKNDNGSHTSDNSYENDLNDANSCEELDEDESGEDKEDSTNHSHPDADVESEIHPEDDDDEDTINPK